MSSLVTCQGRRRIGKSRLIDEFAKRSECRYIKLTGLAPRRKMVNADQIRYFCQRLSRCAKTKEPVASDWIEAFEALDRVLSESENERTLVLLDEISWMGRYDPDFPGYLKDAWDDNLKKHDNLVLVLCGSVSSWIQKNILDSTGFVGRISLEMVLSELSVRESLQFWHEGVSSKEVFDMLSVIGGVPRYLEEIDPSLTTDENVRRLAFLKGGTLFKDFKQIFNDVFGDRSREKGEILKALAFESKTLSEIAEAIGKERNGHLTEALDELELAGFVERERGLNPATGELQKIDAYRIRDNYTRFYLRYVEPYSVMIRRGAYSFVSLEGLPQWGTVLGLQFENLVLNNLEDLISRLGLNRSLVLSCASYRKPAGRNRSKVTSQETDRGCQIDLLIQLKQAMYVVEVKRKDRIDADVVEEVKRKIDRLPNPRGVSVRPVLVYDGCLSPSVMESGYFVSVIKASDLLM
ncbi:MAG: AAA family ATPase [Kiritimatiellae bacterium]|nr:AAA family ATPase [Kiritimatiellia bacterium]